MTIEAFKIFGNAKRLKKSKKNTDFLMLQKVELSQFKNDLIQSRNVSFEFVAIFVPSYLK